MLGIQKALFALHRRAVTLPRAERITDALAALAGPAQSLLDVGAGDGAIAAAIGERVGANRVAGVDVLVRPRTVIEVVPYDGRRLPFPDGAFEIVTISDVLHHCEAPAEVLAECLRVAARAVIVKDHFRFGPVSQALLLAMDVVGNAEAGVLVRGTYFSPAAWIDMVQAARGRITELRWPLRIHDAPMRFVTRDELQFAARIEHVVGMGGGAELGSSERSPEGRVENT
ncbi:MULTISPECIES: methyltransferase domain-containing protein [Polyangium]|uniref:Methyltransferase domain-containing protein n=2 Tax=Polyangium TaxID=55 RepID=A0A4U1IAF6_9BACT|nr:MULTISPECIES: methyltransferase domain-containing protein [Polyangium]MDI1435339.1 methyltransferase domain-containing protein [Polyangium sorediatum]TKC90534.1 methyltransferase domain-containing protein [Polyangium fumosum]